MKINFKFAAALAIGVFTGATVTHAIQAEQARDRPGYIIAEVEKDPSKPQDPAAARRYREETPKTIAAFDGHYVIATGFDKVETLEGSPFRGYLVVLRFPSVEKAREWYHSPAYEAIDSIRRNTTQSRLFLVEGAAHH